MTFYLHARKLLSYEPIVLRSNRRSINRQKTGGAALTTGYENMDSLVTIRMPKSMREKAARRTVDRYKNLSELVRHAVDDLLAREDLRRPDWVSAAPTNFRRKL